MNIMSRHVLRLAGIGIFAIAIPQLASAFEASKGATFKVAMGPTSAAQKNQRPSTTPDDPVSSPKPHHAKHKSGASAHHKHKMGDRGM
jgi:hypothetical protein